MVLVADVLEDVVAVEVTVDDIDVVTELNTELVCEDVPDVV